MNFVRKKFIQKITFRSILATMVALVVITSMSMVLFGFVTPREITISDAGEEIQVRTTGVYVSDLLEEEGIVLKTGDRITPPVNASLKNHGRVEIERAKKIVLTADGTTIDLYSCEPNVRAALVDCGIVLNPYDEIEPNPETAVTDGMEARIYRVNVFEDVRSEKIPKQLVTRLNPGQETGYSAVIEEGWDGAASVTYRVVTRDGEEIIREEINRSVLWEACDQIIEKGTKTPVQTKTVQGKEIRVKKVLECNATAYTASKGARTANGSVPAYGIIAVDPRVIPMGSKMYIESLDGSWAYGYAVAGDTGGAIKGNKVDLYYNSYSECISFGRRKVRVYVLE